MKFLQLFPFYDEYVRDFYSLHPGLSAEPYAEQNARLLADGVGVVHMFARYLAPFGFEAETIFTEAKPAQMQWLASLGGKLDRADDWRHEIAAAQVNAARPDILYVTEPVGYDRRFLDRLTHKPRLVLAWKAAAIPPGTDWRGFDMILSNFRGAFEVGPGLGARRVEFITPGFPETLAEELHVKAPSWDVSFVGSISSEHRVRTDYLDRLARSGLAWKEGVSLGYFLRTAEPDIVPPAVAARNRGGLWGRDMHRVLKGSRIVLNIGVDHAKGETGNMRMIETTGLGAFLLTEHQDNIRKYFEPGVECETFRSQGELEEKIRHYLKATGEREAIARRGRERCRRDFSMAKSLERLAELIHAELG